MRVLRALLLASTLTSPATAAEMLSSNELPFAYEMLSSKEEIGGSARYTTVAVRLQNGPDFFINSANFVCVARNAAGYQWRVSGKALSIKPKELRTIKLVSNGETEPYTRATKVFCLVAGYEIAGF